MHYLASSKTRISGALSEYSGALTEHSGVQTDHYGTLTGTLEYPGVLRAPRSVMSTEQPL